MSGYCPNCGTQTLSQLNETNKCRACERVWTDWQQAEISALKHELATEREKAREAEKVIEALHPFTEHHPDCACYPPEGPRIECVCGCDDAVELFESYRAKYPALLEEAKDE